MTVTEIKIRLDVALKKRFEQACRERETSMTAEINRLIEAELTTPIALPIVAEVIPMVDARPLDGERILAAISQISGRVEELIAAHPQFWFQKWIADHSANERKAMERLRNDTERHQEQTASELRATRLFVKEVAQIVTHRQPLFYFRTDVWIAFGAGICVMILLTLLHR